MANIKSAKKAAKQAEKRRLINNSRKNTIRTYTKKVETAIEGGNEAEAREAYKALEPQLMRGVTKGVFKLNTAARKLRKLAERIRRIGKSDK